MSAQKKIAALDLQPHKWFIGIMWAIKKTAKRKPKAVGRPKIVSAARSERLWVRMSKEELADVDKYRGELNLDRTDLIRLAIAHYISNRLIPYEGKRSIRAELTDNNVSNTDPILTNNVQHTDERDK